MFFVLGAENYDHLHMLQAKSSCKNFHWRRFSDILAEWLSKSKFSGVLFPQKSVGLIGIWSETNAK